MRLKLFILLSSFCLSALAQELPTKTEIISQMRQANDYWISQNANPGNNQWARSVYFTGDIEFYKIYAKQTYLDYANLWANQNNWSLNGGTNTRNADNQTCGQVYIDLYQLDSIRLENKISNIESCIDNMVKSPWSTDWTWIDALYMSMPVFAQLGNLKNDSSYYTKMYDLYSYTKDTLGLFNPTEGLWYRDASYKPPYTTANGKDCYWSRGNGWVIAAHARVLQLLPINDPHRAEYIETFRQMAAALKTRQRDDGFWNTSLDDSAEFNGPETSGTAFFTFGIAWGINNHILDSTTYMPVVEKAWNALSTIALQSNGFLGYVQGVGAQPALAYENSTQDFGVGAFLLAGTEVVKLAPGVMPIANNFNILSVHTIDKQHIKVVFNQSIDINSTINPDHFILSDSMVISDINTGENDSTIIITVNNIPLGKHILSVNNIKDSSGNLIESGESETFIYNGMAAITASSYEPGTDNTPDKTMDFDLSTRWSAYGNGQWIMYDLGSIKTISSLNIAFYNGNIRKEFFSINVSQTNDSTFQQVYNGASDGMSLAPENFSFAEQNARYVKIICYGNSSSLWNSITEVSINSKVISAVTLHESTKKLKLWPNPCNQNGNLFLSSDFNGNVDIKITDLCGRVVFNQEYNAINNPISIKNLNIRDGIYNLMISDVSNSTSKILIIK